MASVRRSYTTVNEARQPTRMKRWLLAMPLIVAAGMCGGCELFGFMAATVGGSKKVPAAYQLPAAHTLVLVDDPQRAFRNATSLNTITADAIYHMSQEQRVDASFVSARQLVDLRAEQNEAFNTMPIDQIADMVDAQQVVQIEIGSARLNAQPGIFRPEATVYVKVIDTASGVRLWPKPGPLSSEPEAPRGQPILIELPSVTSTQLRVDPSKLENDLARAIGKQAAQLFYKHSLPPVGSTLTRVKPSSP